MDKNLQAALDHRGISQQASAIVMWQSQRAIRTRPCLRIRPDVVGGNGVRLAIEGQRAASQTHGNRRMGPEVVELNTHVLLDGREWNRSLWSRVPVC